MRGGSLGGSVDFAAFVGIRGSLVAESGIIPQARAVREDNPDDPALSPWYSMDFPRILNTPEWIFHRNQLMRFAPENQR